MKKISLLVLSVLLMASLVSCKSGDVEATDVQESKITVAVGIIPEATFVEKVAGDLVDVITLIPPGNSPANYQPTSTQMQALSDAAVYFAMQVPAEEANILPKVKDFNKDIEIVNLREVVSATYPPRIIEEHHHHDEDGDEDHEEDHDEDHDQEHEETVDPHIWLSPKRAIIMVQAIADKLSEIDKDNEETYKLNAAEYIKELEALDEAITKKVYELENKTFLMYHPAYGYFADDYGLEMVSLETDGKQATASEIKQVIDRAKLDGITTIYYQEEFDDNQAKTVAEEIGGNVLKVAPLSPDYIGSLEDFVGALISQGE